MAIEELPNVRYTIRRKILAFAGASFHVFDPEGSVVAFCRQKAFKLREDFTVYTDESKSRVLMRMRARQVIDFGATYDVELPGDAPGAPGHPIGSLRRKGFSSITRDSWEVLGPPTPGNTVQAPIATLREDSMAAALARRLIPLVVLFWPQKFVLQTADGRVLAVMRQHMNPFVYRLGIGIEGTDEVIDDLLILGAGCLIAAVEGRQRG